MKTNSTLTKTATPSGAAYAVIILTMMNLLNYVDRFVPSAVKDLFKADLKLTDAQTSWPIAGITIVYMLTSPLFGVELPVLAHPAAEPDKGAGIAMCCTFGDLTDVQWWRELQLPTRSVVGRDGRIHRETPDWITSAAGRAAYDDV